MAIIREFTGEKTLWRELNYGTHFMYVAFPQAAGESSYATWSFYSPRQLTNSELTNAAFRSGTKEVYSPCIGTAELRNNRWYALITGELPADVAIFDKTLSRRATEFVNHNLELVENSLPDGFAEYQRENAI